MYNILIINTNKTNFDRWHTSLPLHIFDFIKIKFFVGILSETRLINQVIIKFSTE